MKRISISLIICVCILTLFACNSVDLEYYINTDIPTFTCVTGLEVSSKEYLSSVDCYAYTYKCDSKNQDKQVDKYIKYLKSEHGYAIVESDDDYSYMTTLAKGNDGILISVYDSDEITVLPYTRAN